MNPFKPGYFDSAELRALGVRVGDDVTIARNCTIVGLENITIGDNVRIDGPTVIAAASGSLSLGSHIHIGGFGFLLCSDGISMGDFSSLSQRVSIYTASDDFSGAALGNPTVPAEFRKPETGPVSIGRYAMIGANCLIMPNLTIGEGVAVGAMSMVSTDLAAWGVYTGNPPRRARERSREVVEKAGAFLAARVVA